MTTGRIETARLAVNLRVEGEGPPLLYLGGSNFDMELRARAFDSALVDRFTLAAYDPRGQGGSDAPDGTWRMADFAADALAVLDALDWPAASLLGESFGAMTALHMARAAPKRVRRMALAAGTAGGEGGGSYPIHELSRITDPLQRAATALAILDRRFPEESRRDPEAGAARIAARAEAEARFLAHRANAMSHPRLLAARAEHDCWDALPSIDVPTLVIAGEFDDQAPLGNVRAMAAGLPRSELFVFPQGHTVLFETPGPVDLICARWIDAPPEGVLP